MNHSIVCLTSALDAAVVIAVELFSTKWPLFTCMLSGFGMTAIESPAFALKVVNVKRAIKQIKKQERTVNPVLEQNLIFMENDLI